MPVYCMHMVPVKLHNKPMHAQTVAFVTMKLIMT